MRVLHIDAGNLYGGVETLLVTLARHRRLCPEMEPEFGVCFEGRLARELAAEGVPVHKLGQVRVRYPFLIWRSRRRLERLIEAYRFDVVVCHMPWTEALFGPVARRLYVPLVFWLHGSSHGRDWVQCWARLTPPDLALCNSHFTARNLPKLYPGTPTETIYCPVAPTPSYENGVRDEVRAEFNTLADVVVIVQVSRLEEWKGHQSLLEALGLLRNLPNWTCWIVGGAQRIHEVRYLERLKLAATQLGIGKRVRFVGQRSDVTRVLAGADIFCQANCRPEPFGIVFIEALYAGLSVVTSAIGGAVEIIDRTCGITVAPDDVRGLATALSSLIDDPVLRKCLGGAGPDRAKALSDPSHQLSRLYEILRSVSEPSEQCRLYAGAHGA
jgi:glycosyltransferase involved in cell wall biosynthesis